MPPAKPLLEAAVDDISKAFALALLKDENQDTYNPFPSYGYTNSMISKIIVDCAEEYILKGHPDILRLVDDARKTEEAAHARAEELEEGGLSSKEAEDDRSRDKIPKACPAIAPLTSALAIAFLDRHFGHDKDRQANKDRFADKMVEYAQADMRGQVSPLFRSHSAQAYESIWKAMEELAVGGVTTQEAAEHLNPRPLWRSSNTKSVPQYDDGLMPQLIRGYCKIHWSRSKCMAGEARRSL